MRNLYLRTVFFLLLILVGVVYVLAFFFSFLMMVAHVLLTVVLLLLFLDILLLFGQKNAVNARRLLPEKLSNGDRNDVKIDLKNNYPFAIRTEVIDEIPVQFQQRDFLIRKKLLAKTDTQTSYTLEPKARGVYRFGRLHIFARTVLGLAERRFSFQDGAELPSYPSFLHLRAYELLAMQQNSLPGGLKKIRKLGHTMEFEQIKEYVRGDDVRTVNWKATSKRNQLMINQFQDEKSQRIYMIADLGRTMQMPFQELSLLDHSINAMMALSHVVLKKGDRAGLITFSRKLESHVSAESRAGQLKKISEALYNVQTDFSESDFARLYQDLKFAVSQRSLLLLFTNFETLDAAQRQMKYLRAIAAGHLLVLIFFKNSEIQHLIQKKSENISEIYDGILAEKLEYEKELIIQELRKYGIDAIYTAPEELSINLINKYLEIKARSIL